MIPNIVRVGFALALLGLAFRPGRAIDYDPLRAAGELYGEGDAVAAYADIGDPSVPSRAVRAHDSTVAYFSPPTALPLLAPFALLGSWGQVWWRFLMALAAIVGIELLYARQPVAQRVPFLFLCVLMFPTIAWGVDLGQSSALLLLLGALCETGRTRTAGYALAAIAALKVWPVFALVAMPRRAAVTALAVLAGLSGVAFLTAGAEPFHVWWALMRDLRPSGVVLTPSAYGFYGPGVTLLAVGTVMLAALMTRRPALGLLAAMLAAPLGWAHYLALLPAIAARGRGPWVILPGVLALVQLGLWRFSSEFATVIPFLGHAAWLTAFACGIYPLLATTRAHRVEGTPA